MPYIREMVTAGRTIEVCKRFSSRYGRRGIPRGANMAPTPEKQKKVNEREAVTKLRRLINHNFQSGDIHLVLGYSRAYTRTPAQARKDLEVFMRRLRSYFRKQGKPLKYITVTEYKSRRIHHHLVISSMDARDIAAMWEYGRPHITHLDSTGQYGQLAEYLVKETGRTFQEPGRAYGKRWNQSRTLEIPVVRKTVIKAGWWRKEPKPVKGYYIEPDSVRAGTHELTGCEYLFYSMLRLDAG